MRRDYDDIRAEREESDSSDYLAALWRGKWLVALITALFIAAGALYIKQQRPLYESSAQIMVVNSNEGAPNAPDNDIPLLTDLRALTRSRSVNTQVQVISSPEVIAEAFEGIGQEARAAGYGAASFPPAWSYKIEGLSDTDIIVIRIKAYTPGAAADFANAIAATYFARDLRSDTEVMRKAGESAETNMKAAARELQKANAELTSFKQRTGFISPDAQLSRAVERSTELAMSLDQANADAAASEHSVSSLRGQLAKQGQTVETSRNLMRSPRLNDIMAKIDDLNSQKIALLQEFTPTSPEVQRVNDAIKQQQAALGKVTQIVLESKTVARNPVRDALVTTYSSDLAEFAGRNARARAVRTAFDNWQASIGQLPSQEREYLDIAQRVAIAQRTFDGLAGKYRTLLLSEQTMLPKGMLISSARPPSVPRYPDKKSALAAVTLVGFIVGAMAAVARDKRDPRARDRQSIERVTGLDTLAVLPEMSRKSPRLLNGDGGNSTLLESFRMLRNSIITSCADVPLTVIAVTSAGGGEGKSTSAANLAVAMAMDGKRTVLVDADMRKPSAHKLLSVPNDVGLSSVLRGDMSLDEALLPTRVENVMCLPAGPVVGDSPELLGKAHTRELLGELRLKYDVVILDCPPCAGLSEMQIISTMVDAVLLVVSMKAALKPRLRATAMSLLGSRVGFLGLVVNRVRARDMPDGHISSYCRYTGRLPVNEEVGNNRTKVKTS